MGVLHKWSNLCLAIFNGFKQFTLGKNIGQNLDPFNIAELTLISYYIDSEIGNIDPCNYQLCHLIYNLGNNILTISLFNKKQIECINTRVNKVRSKPLKKVEQ